MKENKKLSGIIILSLFLLMASSFTVIAGQSESLLNGAWAVQYADGSEVSMTVEKNSFILTIPEVGKIKGMIQTSGNYFESILNDRKSGINFIFGYIKGNKMEGKLQEQNPCAELKKAFKSGVVTAGSNTCQTPFTAVKK